MRCLSNTFNSHSSVGISTSSKSLAMVRDGILPFLLCVHTKYEVDLLSDTITYKINAKKQIFSRQREWCDFHGVTYATQKLCQLKNFNSGETFARRWVVKAYQRWDSPDVTDILTSRRWIRKMEEKIILVVCEHPELYDTASYLYRDRNRKELAWRKVSEEVGLPGKLWKYVLFVNYS